MRLGNLFVFLLILFASCGTPKECNGQVIGSIKTEEYTAGFEKKKSLNELPPYTDTIQIPIQILKIGINDDVYEMYPELKDARVGLGVTNIVLEYLEESGRFVFTEDKLEIKERMVNQFKASNKGFTENKIDGKGKIKLAKYFVYIEVYDFSVGEDEVVETSGITIKQITQLGLQVRFVDAESGEVITGSGQGKAITTKTSTTLGDIEGPAFNRSTVGVSTKKALETSSVRIVEKLIKKRVFKN
jgi:hypothetical protein